VSRCIIICAYNNSLIKDCVDIAKDDYIICADAGYKLAQNEGITPDITIGDFDSMGYKPCENALSLPIKKDDTDTMYCVKYAIEKEYKNIVIVGGIGGRLDQTAANIQILKYGLKNGVNIVLTDANNTATIINSSIELNKRNGYKFSVFSYSEVSKGVNIIGAEYELNNATLYNNYPLGTSNEFYADTVRISVNDGELLIIQSRNN